MTVKKRDKSLYKTSSVICITCSNEFKVFPYRAKSAKFCSKYCKDVKPVSKETRIKLSNAHKGQVKPPNAYSYPKGKSHPNWRGDDVSYRNLHRWVENRLGKPKKCEHCLTTENRAYHWANKSHDYKRDKSDWIRLCVPCHSKYDKKEAIDQITYLLTLKEKLNA